MVQRIYPFFVVCLWLASTSWLIVAKVLPPLLGGTPPDYQAALAREQPKPDYWKIRWNDLALGFAASHVYHHPEGVRELRNVVQLKDAPIDTMIFEALGISKSPGVWSKWARSMIGSGAEFRADLLIRTQVWFDAFGHLSGFNSMLDLGDHSTLLKIDGQIREDGKLEVLARFGEAAGGVASQDGALLRQTVDLPKNVLFEDAFTPRGELKNLHVGQSWTIPVYRPFPPNSPVQILAVEVERHEVVFWEGRDVEAMVLTYRSDAGSGLTASREPLATEWVRSDGLVLRQEVSLSGVRLQFERLPSDTEDPRQKMLDSNQFYQLRNQPARGERKS